MTASKTMSANVFTAKISDVISYFFEKHCTDWITILVTTKQYIEALYWASNTEGHGVEHYSRVCTAYHVLPKTYLPPPWTQQWPDPPTADLLQCSTEHLFPPPWPAQKFLSLAPLLQPSIVHLRPPIAEHLRNVVDN